MSNNDIKRLLDLYEQNREGLASALHQAGGDKDLLLMQPHYRELLKVCTQNWIVLNPKYLPEYGIPQKDLP
jgi:hypothetical protein